MLAALGVLALTAPRLAAQEVPFHVEGTFTFSVKGNRVDASGDGHAAPGGRFTFHDVVRSEYGGRRSRARSRLSSPSGSTLSIYYEAPVSSDIWSSRALTGWSAVPAASRVLQGSGIIWYPIGQGAPFTLDGSLLR